ncbi:MAG: hypothetical protein ABW003_22635, partial [Microvirga sp.]
MFGKHVLVTELPIAMPEPQIPEPSPRDRTTLVKLRAWQCRFVVADDGTEAVFCGAQTQQGSSW